MSGFVEIRVVTKIDTKINIMPLPDQSILPKIPIKKLFISNVRIVQYAIVILMLLYSFLAAVEI